MRATAAAIVVLSALLATVGGGQLLIESERALVKTSSVSSDPKQPKPTTDGVLKPTPSTDPDKRSRGAAKRYIFDADKEFQTADVQSGGQLLELIVKIAEHPNTWKQIHRVLETLEANNAAYTSRILSGKSAIKPGLGLPVLHLGAVDERFGDKRNDVPEKPPSAVAEPKTTFQRWKEVLFAQDAFHPQRQVAEQHENDLKNSPAAVFPGRFHGPAEGNDRTISFVSSVHDLHRSTDSSGFTVEKGFDDRLKDIERELRKLAKLTRWSPANKFKPIQANQVETDDKPIKIQQVATPPPPPLAANASRSSKIAHRFLYHKVLNASADKRTSADGGLWKKIASNRSGGANRRKTFVAVSIAAAAPANKATTEAPPPTSSTPTTERESSAAIKSKLCRKKAHQLWKQHQRNLAEQPLEPPTKVAKVQ